MVTSPGLFFASLGGCRGLHGMKLKDLITRYVEQGLREGNRALAGPFRRRRSELPVARAATGWTLPGLTNADIHRILEEEETGGGGRD
jgi:hypothetical protein